RNASLYISLCLNSYAAFLETSITRLAINPINNDTQVKNTIGDNKPIFPDNGIGAKWSISSVNGLGDSFQKTSIHILITTNKVTKLANINVSSKMNCPFSNDSLNNNILGQNPDKGGIPTKEKNTNAIRIDNFG